MNEEIKLVPVQHSDSIPYLTNTSVAAVRTSGFRLSVFRFLVSPPFHPLPPLRVAKKKRSSVIIFRLEF